MCCCSCLCVHVLHYRLTPASSFSFVSDSLVGNLVATATVLRTGTIACMPCGPAGCDVAAVLVSMDQPASPIGVAPPRVSALRVASDAPTGQLSLLQLTFGEGTSQEGELGRKHPTSSHIPPLLAPWQ